MCQYLVSMPQAIEEVAMEVLAKLYEDEQNMYITSMYTTKCWYSFKLIDELTHQKTSRHAPHFIGRKSGTWQME